MQVEHQGDRIQSKEEVEYAIPSVESTVLAQDTIKFTQVIAMVQGWPCSCSDLMWLESSYVCLHIIIAESILQSSR